MEINNSSTYRIAGYAAITGSLCAITGAALGIISGADLDVALSTQSMDNYLITAADNLTLLVSNLSIWIVMAFLMGIAAHMMTIIKDQNPVTAQIARFCYNVGVPLVIGAYSAWLAFIVQAAPDTSPNTVLLAKTFGWFASRADWIATILVVGIGPTFLAAAGRKTWAPSWLVKWSYLTAFSGFLNAVAMLTGGSGLSTYGFAIIPVGVGWMIAAGIVLLRKS